MAYTLVQEAHDFSYPAAGQPVLATSAAVTKGNLLVAWCSSVSPSNQVISDAVNGGNYNPSTTNAGATNWLPCLFQQPGGYGVVSAWYCIAKYTRITKVQFYDANLATTNDFVGVPANLNYPGCQILEYSGNSLNPFDAATFASGTGVTPASAVAASLPNELIIGIAVPGTVSDAISVGAGWISASGGNQSAVYKVESSAGSYTPALAQSPSSAWGALSISFKPTDVSQAVAGNLGSGGVGATVVVVSKTTNYPQQTTADGSGNYLLFTSQDSYIVQPQLVGRLFSPMTQVTPKLFAGSLTSTASINIDVGDCVVVWSEYAVTGGVAPTDNGAGGGNAYVLVNPPGEMAYFGYMSCYVCLSARVSATQVTNNSTSPLTICAATFSNVLGVASINEVYHAYSSGDVIFGLTTTADNSALVAGFMVDNFASFTATAGSLGSFTPSNSGKGTASLYIGNVPANHTGVNLSGTAAAIVLSSSPTSFAVQPTTAARNNYDGCVGFAFVAGSNLRVTSLGRLYVSGNTQDHVIKLWKNSTTCIASGTILASSASDANGFKWVSVTPALLTSGGTYYIAIDETSGGDTWTQSWVPSLESYFTNIVSRFGSTGAFPNNNDVGGSILDTPALAYEVLTPTPDGGQGLVLELLCGSANFTSVAVNNRLILNPTYSDSGVRANENPLSQGGNWIPDGGISSVPPNDCSLQLLNHEFCLGGLLGTVNTNGTAVTWVSGNKFGSTIAQGITTISPGSQIIINNVVYIVATYSDSEHFALTTSAGVQTGVNYSSVVANFGGPFAASGISMYRGNGITFPDDQFIQIQIDAINPDPLSWAGIVIGLDWSYEMRVYNNGDGTLSLNFPGNMTFPGGFLQSVPFTMGDTIGLAQIGGIGYVLHNGAVIANFNTAFSNTGQLFLIALGHAVADTQLSHFKAGSAALRVGTKSSTFRAFRY